MPGLTRVRDTGNAFPFVEGLVALAEDVRSILGGGTRITYAADWSEYFGYHPQDGSGDVFFHLDELWASEAIDCIGIDNYMPLSDWRDEDVSGGNPDGAASAYDLVALKAAITGGEGFDWYYASPADRHARVRTPIGDGATARTGCSDTRTFPVGGRICITIGSAAWNRHSPRRGCPCRSPSISPSSVAGRWTRGPISRTCFATRSPLRTVSHIFRTAAGPTSHSTGSC